MIDNFKPYIEEFNRLFTVDKSTEDFHVLNHFFMSGDAEFYYAFIKYYKPSLVIEIGGGFSSILADKAGAKLVVIEPKASRKLIEYASGKFEIVQSKLQDVDLKMFDKLQPGDILFIDSSHRYDIDSDVEVILEKILPNLKSGVFIHFHDICWPKQYNDIYSGQQWNEQEEVRKILDEGRCKILWCGSEEHEKDVENMKKIFPSYVEMLKVYPKARASSLWLVKC